MYLHLIQELLANPVLLLNLQDPTMQIITYKISKHAFTKDLQVIQESLVNQGLLVDLYLLQHQVFQVHHFYPDLPVVL